MSTFPFMELIPITSLFSGKSKQLNHFCTLFKAWMKEVIQGHVSNSWSSIAFFIMNYKLCKIQKESHHPWCLTSSLHPGHHRSLWLLAAVSAKPHEFPPMLTVPQGSHRARSQTPISCHVCHIGFGDSCADTHEDMSAAPLLLSWSLVLCLWPSCRKHQGKPCTSVIHLKGGREIP